MHSAKQILDDVVGKIGEKYEPMEARNIAAILLEDSFSISKEDILLDEKVAIDLDRLENCVVRLLQNEPIQYVTGQTHFLGRIFKVQKGVLIPRPETEELVRMIVDANIVVNPKILDVGAGSGCIAISLALETHGKAAGLDVSEDALRIAKENSSALGGSIEFILHDILSSNPPISELDILVSNPPYIPERDKKQMHDNVLGFEPKIALFVSDDNPLIFYQRISTFGKGALKPGGKLYFELHEEYADEVKSLVEDLGYSEVIVHKDMQGKNRMLSATNSANR
ncbi:MAG: peptide chain release factor N(5)-glutamine methyltransferase [Cyclobacteriaceae bacterium]